MSPPPATSAAASVPAPLDPAGALVVMPDSSAGDARRVSELLAQLGARLEPGRISLGEIVAALGSRSLGSFLLVLAIPTVMPVPLGLSVLFNLPVLIYALQLARGRGTLGLPRWLMRRSIDTGDLKHLISRTLALLRGVEHLTRPRLLRLTAPTLERWIGRACLVMAGVAIIPLPLVGWLPGFGLVLVSLGLIERDGVAVALGLTLGTAGLAFFLTVVHGLLWAGNALLT